MDGKHSYERKLKHHSEKHTRLGFNAKEGTLKRLRKICQLPLVIVWIEPSVGLTRVAGFMSWPTCTGNRKILNPYCECRLYLNLKRNNLRGLGVPSEGVSCQYVN